MQETDRVQAQIERLQLRDHMEQRPRALAHSLWVNRLRALLNPRAWKCVDDPSSLRHRSAADSRSDAPALRHEVGCHAQRLFHEGDYRALDALIRKSAAKLNDLPDGSSSVAAVFSSLSTLIDYGGYQLEALLGKTADWRRAVGDPLMADLVEVLIFQQWAWTARGHATAHEVSGQAWYYFAHRSEMAAAALRAIEKTGQQVPMWHDFSIDIALDLSLDTAKIRAIFDRGVERFPGYHPLYAGMLRVLMPRWQGSYEDVERFIVDMSRRGDDQDLELYAELYWTYFLLERDDCNIFVDAMASWNNVDIGFAELVKRHPRSDYLLNAYVVMACLIHDRERYSELRPRIARRLSESAWSEKYSLARCDSDMRWPR
jgi:hypothetical protein